MPSLQRRFSDFYYDKFPAKFKWGSTSACQIEGAWSDDGRRSSWWDTYFRKSSLTSSNGSESESSTADSYHKFDEDVMLLKSMNATSYQFSLSWSRILPDGTLPRVNKVALDYYDSLINTLIENGIEPIVTLYSWDLPDALYEKYPNSWMDENVIKAFGKYAQLCFSKFGDRVRRWVTINDPWTHSECGYDGYGNHPPSIQGWKNESPYKVYANLLKAHTLAYRIYDKGFRRRQHGKIGISINSKCVASACLNQLNTSVPHAQISEICGPISMDPNPKTDNKHMTIYNWAWLEVTKNPSDFISLTHEAINQSLNTSDVNHHYSSHCHTTKRRGSNGSSETREILNTIREELGNPEVLVCGKGLPLLGNDIQSLIDLERIEYFKTYANEVLKCVMIDGCNVIGFLPGTLLDTPDWDAGFV